MAKKKAAKKSTRRLKRTARRSLAAVLMITAIVVAAIPVPENLATDGGVTPGAGTETPGGNDAKYEEQIEIGDPIEYDDATGDVVYSLVVYEKGLYWQYKIDKKSKKILQYNSSFPATSLSVSQHVPTNYDYVLRSAFDGFCEKNFSLSYENGVLEEEPKGATKFFEKYFKNDAEYKAFQQNKEGTISRSVEDLASADKATAYCEMNGMSGYTLQDVKVAVGTGGDADSQKVLEQIGKTGKNIADGNVIYIPQYTGGDPAPSNEIDENKYRLYSTNDPSFSNTQQVTKIGGYAFAGSGVLQTIALPDGMTEVGTGAFMGCNYLSAVNIPFLREIPDGAFKNCTSLTDVNWWFEKDGVKSSNLQKIGKEAFYGSGVQRNRKEEGFLTFPKGILQINEAAFYNCGSLKNIVFDSSSDSVEIERYAFYDNTELSGVDFQKKAVNKMGDYCFAMGVVTNRMESFTFPDSSFTVSAGGGRILSKRTALRDIIVPEKVKNLEGNILEGCTGLRKADFKGVSTSYDSALFSSVAQEEFYVTGPATTDGMDAVKDNVEKASEPRKSTWGAKKTALDKNVPYLYKIGGKDFYEICNEDGFLESVDKTTGTLTSCVLKPGTTLAGDGVLVIPDSVAGTDVLGIGTDCFTDVNLTEKVTKLVINDKIKRIEESTFENIKKEKWNKLREVTIGSAVEWIGKNAFFDCTALTDITFKTPDGGDYGMLDPFGESALKTNGDRLTIHGDIKENYVPFTYATASDTYVKSADDGIRVRYQSRWDSPGSKHLSLMYGKSSDPLKVGKAGYVTLLDYPKYDELKEIDDQKELGQYCREREQEFYEKYSKEIYDGRRVAFANAWDAASNEADVYNGKDTNGDFLYGPWIDAEFCKEWSKWKDESPTGTAVVEADGMFGWLFEPLTAQAASNNPKPYFTKKPFNFVANYEEYGGNVDLIPKFDGDWIDYLGWNDFEEGIIHSVEEIVIPAGVESIDVEDFYKNNESNYIGYFSNKMTDGEVSGLFNGLIEDYENNEDKTKYETEVKGNDRIESVAMASVKYLPENAFESCERLTTVSMPDVQKVGDLPFKGCKNLVKLSGSDMYPVERGILYEKHMKDARYRIVECLTTRGKEGSEVKELEESVVSVQKDSSFLSKLCETCEEDVDKETGEIVIPAIRKSAFEGCAEISEVNLGGVPNLVKISEAAFKNCTALRTVDLPSSVRSVENDAFNGSQAQEMSVYIRGREMDIADSAFRGNKKVMMYAYDGSAAMNYALRLKKEGVKIEHKSLGSICRVSFYDGEKKIGDTLEVPKGTIIIDMPKETLEPRPNYKFKEQWVATTSTGKELILDGRTKIEIVEDPTTFKADYERISGSGTVNGEYIVEFYDYLDNKLMSGVGANVDDGKYHIKPAEPGEAEKSFEELKYKAPGAPNGMVLTSYRALGGSPWTEKDPINRSMIIFVLYEPANKEPSPGTTSSDTTSNKNPSGGSTSNPSKGSTSNPSKGSTGNTSNNSTSGGSSGNNGGNSSTTSSTSNTSNTSNSSNASNASSTSNASNPSNTAGQYTVFVENGSGSGSYAAGTTVIISANIPAAGMKFDKWTTDSNGVTLTSVSIPVTTFTMPANNVTVKANYVADTAAPATGAAPGSGAGSGSGGTRLDIEKPGISNRDLATANVNGSTDNFVVKISETDEATRAVAAALTKKYGTLDNILYYAMDISLYDSTGSTKLTDTTGLSVDITVPIPDALVAYGGNNMAGAVVNGDQLEGLGESFTTINGVPCIRFRATHFSPYTVYVDTGNLVEGMLDVTPKTGDPIHPKWFLSLGLACLSILLFMQRDRRVKVRTKA